MNYRRLLMMLSLIMLSWQPHTLSAAEKEKVITRITIETTDKVVKIHLTSSQQVTWKMVKQKAALVFSVAPVDPDPNTPKEIPINSGLIRKVRFVQLGDKERNLMIVVDVVPFPAYQVNEEPQKKGIFIVLDREVMEGSRNNAAMSAARNSAIKKGDQHKYSILMTAAAVKPPAALEPPLVPAPPRGKVNANKEMFYKKEPKSLKHDLELVQQAAAGSPRQQARKGQGEMLNCEFNREDLLKMLKFMAGKMGLSLAASPQVKGTKSIVLNEVTAEEAVRLILKSTPFTYRVERNVLLVGPPEMLKSFSLEELNTQDTEEETRVIMVKKMRAEGLISLLQEHFPTARITPYTTLNALIVTAGPRIIDRMEAYIRQLEQSGAEDRENPGK
jgi:hypothetical protein